MVVVANAKINETRAAANSAAPVVPNVINDTLPDGNVLSIGVVENTKMNEAQFDADSDAPVAPNVLNDALADGGMLSM